MPPDERPDGHPGQQGEGAAPTWLVIPYFDGDLGRPGAERPVDESVVPSWLCPSIVVNGDPGGTAFRRGEPFDVEVRVANHGGGALPAIALVRLWWCDPTLAFAAATLLFQVSVPIAPTGVPRTIGPYRVTIPLGASPHACLLAQASAPLDGAPATPDPAGDRHWGQHNLVEATAAAGDGTVLLPVTVANPFDAPARTVVTLGPMPPSATRRLSQELGRDVIVDEEATLEVDVAEGERLEPRSARTVTAAIRTRLASPGAPVGVVLTQRVWRPGEEETPLQGSLGVLVGG